MQIAPAQEKDIDISKVKNRLMFVLGHHAGHHDIYLSYLQSWGLSVQASEDLAETQTLLEQAQVTGKPYEAILLAGLSVSELLNTIRSIRAQENFGALPIIVCQSSREPDVRRELYESGADNVLTNPVKQSTLFNSLIEVFYSNNLFEKTSTSHKYISKDSIDASLLKHRLLLVEDNVVNQKISVRLLEKMGFDVDVANDGQEACNILKTKSYDLVLMDCQMPVMDGFEATRVIRHDESELQKRTPIIAMTANAMLGDRERCLNAGMDDYITKPINADSLAAALKKWLSKNRENNAHEIGNSDTEINAACPIAMERMTELFGDDDEIIDELLSVFYDSLEPLRIKLAVAVAERATDIKAVAHEIKGSAFNVGAVILASLAEKLEQAAVQQDWMAIDMLMMQIQSEIDQAKYFIENRK